MKFFIDTANIEEIRKACELGVIDGVTTNPTLIAKEKKDPITIFKEICAIVARIHEYFWMNMDNGNFRGR